MKAVVLYKSGGPENFVIETRPVREPGEGEVLVKIKAFGGDLKVNTKEGEYTEFIVQLPVINNLI